MIPGLTRDWSDEEVFPWLENPGAPRENTSLCDAGLNRVRFPGHYPVSCIFVAMYDKVLLAIAKGVPGEK